MSDLGHMTWFSMKSEEVEMYQVAPIVTPCTLRDFCRKNNLHLAYDVSASDWIHIFSHIAGGPCHPQPCKQRHPADMQT